MSVPSDTLTHIRDEELNDVLASRKNRPCHTNMLAYDGNGGFYTTSNQTNGRDLKKCMNKMIQHVKKDKLREQLRERLQMKRLQSNQ